MGLPSPESVGLGGQRTVNGLTYQVVAGTQGQLAWDAVTTGTHGRRLEVLEAKGATADRPSAPSTGTPYFDTDLGIPLWYNGTNWVDATGATR